MGNNLWDGEKWIKPPKNYCSDCKKFINGPWCLCNRCARRRVEELENVEQRKAQDDHTSEASDDGENQDGS